MLDEEAIFQAARRLAGDARLQYLDLACPADGLLRKRVEQLLAVHDAGGSFLEASPAAVATIERPPAERPGTRVGRYRLLENIGEGGMGTVWVAEQTEPVKRRVALKLIKPGMDSRQVLSRFEAERQALALMDHPNIAKVYDGGMTDEARPYFVMEYVKGMPITEYCDSARLSIHDRLKLFIPVCQAVQHAHQKGIIHRDLKPSNILVCLYDGQPIPKLLDFGLAKAMHQPLTEHTLYTAHGLMVGTPIYMSPEQAEFNNLDVDTRTDIYSLGVILYELLTGTTPLEKRQFKDAAFQEILRLIKDVEPQRPSLKISSLSRVGLAHRSSGAASPNAESGGHSPPYTRSSLEVIAAQRSLDPTQLSRAVRGDLDWIVMKSLEKERSRRYETATGLARDIERFLRDEVVEARPPATLYKIRKFTRRNRVAVFLSLFVAASLLAVLVNYALGLRSVRKQRDRAVLAENQSRENLQKLQQVAREWATSETLTGDTKRAEAAVQLAEAANVPKAWTEVLRARSEIAQGHSKAALIRLRPITSSINPNDDADTRLAALSLLAQAGLADGHQLRYFAGMKDVREASRDFGPEAALFKAAAEAFADHEAALRDVDLALQKRPYPAALYVRAQARASKAALTLDQKLVVDALDDLRYAELFAGNNASTLLGKLQVLGIGSVVANYLQDNDMRAKHRAAIAECLKDLEKLPASQLASTPPVTVIFISGAYRQLNQHAKADEIEWNTDWSDTMWIHWPSAWFYQYSTSSTDALQKFERLRFDPDSPHGLVSRAHFLADFPEHRSELPAIYERSVANRNDFEARYAALPILALMADPQKLKDEARTLLRDGGHQLDLIGIVDGLRFLSGEWSEERALTEASSSILKRPTLYHAIGIQHLAAGKREAARESFDKCHKTRAFTFAIFNWCRAYVARMNRDPNWPSWIEKKTADE